MRTCPTGPAAARRAEYNLACSLVSLLLATDVTDASADLTRLAVAGLLSGAPAGPARTLAGQLVAAVQQWRAASGAARVDDRLDAYTRLCELADRAAHEHITGLVAGVTG